MQISILNDPIVHRTSVLYDVLGGKSLEETEKGMEKAYGKDAMEYTEMDYWYFYFYHGGRDLHHERSESRQLTSLPEDALKHLLDRITVTDRLILRKVCHKFQDLVDSKNFPIKNISMICTHKHATLLLNNSKIVYRNVKNGCFLQNDHHLKYRDGIMFKDRNYISLALEDVKEFLKNSKISLNHFTLELLPDEIDKNVRILFHLENFFKSLKHQIQVAELYLKRIHLENVLSVLPSLKPGVLKTINIYYYEKDEKDLEAIKKINLLDQWKEAKNLGMWMTIQNTSIFSNIDYFSHFSQITLLQLSHNVDAVPRIREILENYPHLDTLQISTGYKLTDFRRLFSQDFIITHDSAGIGHAEYSVSGAIFDVDSKFIKYGHLDLTFKRRIVL